MNTYLYTSIGMTNYTIQADGWNEEGKEYVFYREKDPSWSWRFPKWFIVGRIKMVLDQVSQ